MAQYHCEMCGAEFDTLSGYRRHMQTSHPERAPSAADLEQALSGIAYPAPRGTLVRHARDNGEDEIADILKELPDREYLDAADVARAFGGIRAHEKKTDRPAEPTRWRSGNAGHVAFGGTFREPLFGHGVPSLCRGPENPGARERQQSGNGSRLSPSGSPLRRHGRCREGLRRGEGRRPVLRTAVQSKHSLAPLNKEDKKKWQTSTSGFSFRYALP